MTWGKTRLVALLALGLALTVGASGCGLVAKKAVEGATGVKVEGNNSKMTVTGKAGETATIQGGKLPEGFPSEFPVYKGTVKMGNKVENGGKVVYSVLLMTSDAPKTVIDWYDTELKKAGGWTIEARNDNTSAGNDVSMLSATSSTQQAVISASSNAEGKQTGISISLSDK